MAKNLILWLVIAVILMSLFESFSSSDTQGRTLDYTTFVREVQQDQVQEVVFDGQVITGMRRNGEQFITVMPIHDSALLDNLLAHNVRASGTKPEEPSFLTSVFVSWFPMILLIAVWIFFMRQMNGGGKGNPLSFGKSKAKLLSENQVKTTFADVAGCDEAKEDVVELVDFLRDPTKYSKLGGRIPRGVLMVGPPGTGKTYLAKEIAADIISNGYFDDYTFLTEEQKQQVEFVQFHPGYDYSDFVEGLRPKLNNDGSMGFELKDGIFKKFIDRARKNYEDSQKTKDTVEKEVSVQRVLEEFFSGIEFGVDTFKTINGNEFTITDVDDEHIYISIPGNATVNHLALNLAEVRKMLESGQQFEKVKDITTFFKKTFATQGYSYDFAIYHAIKSQKIKASNVAVKQEELKKYIFIIDEINRGEISKIFGELFFAIDPGYRGEEGAISTQYASLHADPNEKFYIPDNVYIIGTMNDIDRSVDSFDFAMRRRFRFVEIKADDRLEMLANLKNEKLRSEAIRRMSALNKEIAAVEDLNENYQIGAAYFLKLQTLNFDKLWTDYLKPLLQEYIQGMYDEKAIMDRFAKAYGYQDPKLGDVDEATQDQG